MRVRTLRGADERVEEAMMTSNTNGLARGEEEGGRDRRASSPSLSSSSGGRRSSSRRATRESAAEAVATGKMWAERKIGKRRERRKALPEAPADVAPMVERNSNRLVQPTALTTARDVAHDAAGDCKNQQQNEGWLQEPQMMQRRAVPPWVACY